MRLLFTLLLTLTSSLMFAQITINSGAGYTATDLVNYLVPASNVTSVSSQNIKGVMGVSSRYQAGYFTTATSTQADMGFNSGIVLSTGNVNDIPLSLGTNPGSVAQMSRGYTSSTAGEIRGSQPTAARRDEDARNLIDPENYYNAVILEFEFVPLSGSLEFRYIFGSEEYDDQSGSAFGINYNCSSYNDKFAFVLSGPGISGGQGYIDDGINIARLSNNSEVGINSVNGGVVGSSGGAPNAANCTAANPAWVQNSNTAEFQGFIDGTELNGNTEPLTASYNSLTPGLTYKIRLVIADAKDGAYDSVVYLEEGSFNTTSPPLSANLDSFNGECLKNGNNLSWTSSEETNNSHFILESSNDGDHFQALSTIESNGDDLGTNLYTYLDKNASNGTTYYRLSQVDIDGTFETLRTIAVNSSCIENNSSINAYIFDGNLNIQLENDNSDYANIKIFNAAGQIVQSERISISSKSISTILKSNIKNSIYIIQIETEKGLYNKQHFIR